MDTKNVAIDADLHTKLKIKVAIEQKQIGDVVNALVRKYVMDVGKIQNNIADSLPR